MSKDRRSSHEYSEEPLEETDEEYQASAGRQPHYTSAPEHLRQRPRRRKRRFWPLALLGCAGVICLVTLFAGFAISHYESFVAPDSNGGLGSIMPGSVYTLPDSQTLSLTNLNNVNIHNQIGNVTVLIDQNANQATLKTMKRVKADSQSHADQEFRNVVVTLQQDNNGLKIDSTIPTKNGSFPGNNNDNVDIQLTLPPPPTDNLTPFQLTVDLSVGQIKVTGASGLLQVSDDIGDIQVQGASLEPGSHITTANGNVTFGGSLDANSNGTSDNNTGTATTTPTASATPGSSQQNYAIKSEVGNIELTLPSTNVILDANTNNGKLSSDFQLTPAPTQDGNSVNFYGPLLPQANPTQTLVAHVGSGNITLHRAA